MQSPLSDAGVSSRLLVRARKSMAASLAVGSISSMMAAAGLEPAMVSSSGEAYSFARWSMVDDGAMNDAIVGAPDAGEDGRGRAYVLLGGAEQAASGVPLAHLGLVADLKLASPFTTDYQFGLMVGAMYDLDGDGMGEVRILSLTSDEVGGELALTHVFSGADGAWLFTTSAMDDFDPWAELAGDATGDGAVTQRDLDLVLGNLGLQGMELTLRDGDLNGDGVVDAADVAMVLDHFGATMFDLISFDNAGAVNGAITAGGSNVRRFQQIGGIIAPCDKCPTPCAINCCGYSPCNPACGAACDPGCGGDPCNPACPSSGCNPDCPGSDPCDPACAVYGGGPCGDNCNTAPCNPDCGGNAGPCNPWRVSEHLL